MIGNDEAMIRWDPVNFHVHRHSSQDHGADTLRFFRTLTPRQPATVAPGEKPHANHCLDEGDDENNKPVKSPDSP
jgi:hypothetical protein